MIDDDDFSVSNKPGEQNSKQCCQHCSDSAHVQREEADDGVGEHVEQQRQHFAPNVLRFEDMAGIVGEAKHCRQRPFWWRAETFGEQSTYYIHVHVVTFTGSCVKGACYFLVCEGDFLGSCLLKKKAHEQSERYDAPGLTEARMCRENTWYHWCQT